MSVTPVLTLIAGLPLDPRRPTHAYRLAADMIGTASSSSSRHTKASSLAMRLHYFLITSSRKSRPYRGVSLNIPPLCFDSRVLGDFHVSNIRPRLIVRIGASLISNARIGSIRTTVVRHPRVVTRLPRPRTRSGRPVHAVAAGPARGDRVPPHAVATATARGNRTRLPRGRTTPTHNWKTLAFAAISIFLHVFCSAEKRLTIRARTYRGRAPEAAPDHRT